MGFDRPSPDHANARVIFLISSHLEAGHYFNPHAQRIIEGKQRGAKVICVDPRLSNTASMVDHWLPAGRGRRRCCCWPSPGCCSRTARGTASSSGGGSTGRRSSRETRPDLPWPVRLRRAGAARALRRATRPSRRRPCAASTQRQIREIGVLVGAAPGPVLLAQLAGVRGRQRGRVADGRCLWLLNVLTGSVGTVGGTSPNGWNKFIPVPPKPVHPHGPVERADLADRVPARPPRDVDAAPPLPEGGPGPPRHLLHPRLQPGLDEPGRVLVARGPDRRVARRVPRGAHADLVRDGVVRRLRAADGRRGRAPRRGLLRDAQPGAGSASASRCSRSSPSRGRTVQPHLGGEPGRGVGGERVLDRPRLAHRPRRLARHPQPLRVDRAPRQPITIDEYYEQLFTDSVPGPAGGGRRARASPRSSSCGATAPSRSPATSTSVHEQEVSAETVAAAGAVRGDDGVLRVPGHGRPPRAARGHQRPHAVHRRRVHRRRGRWRSCGPGSRRRPASWSSTPRRCATGAGPSTPCPRGSVSHVHWEDLDFDGRRAHPDADVPDPDDDPHPLGGNAKWLNEISHRHPLWIHPSDAEQLGIEVDGLVRITTQLGWFVIRAWRTEGIRPGVVGASHHMGRWRLEEAAGGQRWASGMAGISDPAGHAYGAGGTGASQRWSLRQQSGVAPFTSDDPDSQRVWWSDAGVHQNLTFPVQPDPVSGMHCWLQHVTVGPAQPQRPATATSWSTPPARPRCTASGWPRLVPDLAPTDCAGRCGSPARSSRPPPPIERGRRRDPL